MDQQTNEGPKALRINVRQIVSEPESREDEGLAGVYAVHFKLEDIGAMTEQKRASIALDIFHRRQAIGCLDDFEIDVIDPDGKVVNQDERHEDYSYSDGGDVEKVSDTPAQIEGREPDADCPSWGYVCEHFGLDESFDYSDNQREEYYRLLKESNEKKPTLGGDVNLLLAESARDYARRNAVAGVGDLVETIWGDWKGPHKVRVTAVGAHLVCRYSDDLKDWVVGFAMNYSAERLRKDGSSIERGEGMGICLDNLRTADGKEWAEGGRWNEEAGFNHAGLSWMIGSAYPRVRAPAPAESSGTA